ncbi:MAG: phosphotransferase, partial [Actinomycetota bacterium]
MKNNFYGFRQAFEILKSKGIIRKDSSFINVMGGLVHDVRRIKSGNKIFYLKIRLDHFKTDKTIKIVPSDINFEKRAIELLMDKCHSGTVPKLIHTQDNFLLLEDVKNSNTKCVYDMLYGQKINSKEVWQIGREMRQFHQNSLKIKEKIRSQSDENSLYGNYLYWRFGVWKNKDLNLLIEDLKEKCARQYIYGDFNPKNMFFSRGRMRLIDLETFHKGNTIFDVGFFGGHILFHFLNNKPLAKELIEEYFSGYGLNVNDYDVALRLIFATVYY